MEHADPATIRRALALLVAPGATVELRCPDTDKRTMSGYYTDIDALAEQAARLSGRVPAVYITLNPVLPDLIARAVNRTRGYAKFTTSDADIVERRWLGIDFDAVRSAGISATDAEHAAALDRARACRDWLDGEGFGDLLLADSGNGGHVLMPFARANDAAALREAEGMLAFLSGRFTDEQVKVDLATANAARIWKLYGTMVCKGDDWQGSDAALPRPWRMARLLDE